MCSRDEEDGEGAWIIALLISGVLGFGIYHILLGIGAGENLSAGISMIMGTVIFVELGRAMARREKSEGK